MRPDSILYNRTKSTLGTAIYGSSTNSVFLGVIEGSVLLRMCWICTLTIHFIATDLRQFFEVKSYRPLYNYIKRLWASFDSKCMNLDEVSQSWNDLTRSVEIGASGVAYVASGIWRNIASLRITFIELTIIRLFNAS